VVGRLPREPLAVGVRGRRSVSRALLLEVSDDPDYFGIWWTGFALTGKGANRKAWAARAMILTSLGLDFSQAAPAAARRRRRSSGCGASFRMSPIMTLRLCSQKTTS